ncbi:hypothetical protein JCM8202v2_002973 [Rhodotorula sphaerocarpa]
MPDEEIDLFALRSSGQRDACSFQALIWVYVSASSWSDGKVSFRSSSLTRRDHTSDNLDDLPSRQLKRKVDQLETLLQSLPSAADVLSPPLPSPPLPDAAAGNETGRTSPSAPAPANGKPVRMQDCDALVRMLLSDCAPPSLASLDLDVADLSAKLRRDELDHPSRHPIFDAPHPAALHARVSEEEYQHHVEHVLPSVAQAQLALTSYFTLSNGFLRLIHPPTFLAQCEVYWSTGFTADGNWVATYLLVCGYGLLAAPDGDDRVRRQLLPHGLEKEPLARTWFEAARQVLAVNHFNGKESVEGVRAFVLLVQWWMTEGARYAEATLAVSVTVVSTAFDLQLNRDPDEVDPSLPPHEAETRRAIFWTLYVFESMVRPMLGKAWHPFDDDDISVRRPQPEDANSPAHLYEAAILNARISKLINRRKMLSPDAVSAVFDDVEAFLETRQHSPLVTAMARFSYNRLHRFARQTGLSNAQRDESAARVLSELLESIRRASESPDCPAIVLLRAFSAAIASAAELCRTPHVLLSTSAAGSQLLRLLDDLPHLPFPPPHSRLIRRANLVLRALLPRPEEAPPFDISSYPGEVINFAFDPLQLDASGTEPTDAHCPVYPLSNGFVATEHYLPDTPDSMPPPISDRAATRRPSMQYEGHPSAQAGIPYRWAASLPADQPPLDLAEPSPGDRPVLSVSTSILPPQPPLKLATPFPGLWVDAAITPSRYIDGQPWERF